MRRERGRGHAHRSSEAAELAYKAYRIRIQASNTAGDAGRRHRWRRQTGKTSLARPGGGTQGDCWTRVGPGTWPKRTVRQALTLRWSMADPRPLVLLIDEIDALVGDTLLAVLRQLRTGIRRPP